MMKVLLSSSSWYSCRPKDGPLPLEYMTDLTKSNKLKPNEKEGEATPLYITVASNALSDGCALPDAFQASKPSLVLKILIAWAQRKNQEREMQRNSLILPLDDKKEPQLMVYF